VIPVEDLTTLSLLLHLNSEPREATEDDLAAGYRVDYLSVGFPGSAVSLPRPSDSPLAKLIHDRYSCRTFQKRVMPLGALATLLWAANGLTRQSELPGGTVCFNRSIPSAGGLYPLEVYALIQRVGSVPDGLYHYGVWDHTLEPTGAGASFQDFRESLLAFPFIQDANVVLFLSAIFLRTQHKYKARGYRYILLEAGHSAENICLAATEAGLASLCIGGYLDRKLNAMLGLNATKAGVVYVVGVGYPGQA